MKIKIKATLLFDCPLMHFTVLRRIDPKLGRVVERGLPRFKSNFFEVTSPKVKGHPEVMLP